MYSEDALTTSSYDEEEDSGDTQTTFSKSYLDAAARTKYKLSQWKECMIDLLTNQFSTSKAITLFATDSITPLRKLKIIVSIHDEFTKRPKGSGNKAGIVYHEPASLYMLVELWATHLPLHFQKKKVRAKFRQFVLNSAPLLFDVLVRLEMEIGDGMGSEWKSLDLKLMDHVLVTGNLLDSPQTITIHSNRILKSSRRRSQSSKTLYYRRNDKIDEGGKQVERRASYPLEKRKKARSTPQRYKTQKKTNTKHPAQNIARAQSYAANLDARKR